MKMKLLACCLLLSLMTFAQNPPEQKPADTIFVNGDIYTGAVVRSSTQRELRATAMAVREGRILALGTQQDVRKFKCGSTKVIDLGGHFAMPGFNDAHLHLASGGFEKLNVDLVGAKSLKEMQAKIASRASAAAPGEWVIGRGWDHTNWPDKKLPTRQDMDAVTQQRPAYFVRVDGHIAIANSAALKAAGITRDTKDPAGGKIDRDPQGQPTGMLRETAQELVKSKIPRPSPEQRRRAIELALATLHSGALPRCRTTPVGRTFSFTRTWNGRANSRRA